MILAETLLFSLSLIDCGGILFLLVYYIITLSDLECDYLNAQECCEKLNYWLLPKYIAHSFVTFLLLLHGQVILFLCNLPMFIWLTFEYFTIPSGNLGAFDPAEIHNRGQLKRHLRHVMYNIAYYLVFFFIYLYCFILALLKGNPIRRGSDDEIVTEI
ncbi:protein cornichon homolog 4 [Pectinophora gossypiella]|uniref:protein cornichon homolog 4 n=1 Tax=Pectinophora gossypiella TaxID=13191 RepID=UPI00214EC61B|nr:protein cornichon homolog 4 [Pectinophora gossypiella]